MCHSSCGPSMQAMWKHQESKNLEALWENYHLLVLLFRKRIYIYIYIDEMVNKCQQQVRPVQLHFRTLTWFVTKSESQPFIWRPFFVQRHSTAQSNCCTRWKSGARGAQALAEIPQEPQPPWRLWVWPVSLHSFGALFLLCGTQPHNPTAALNERAARGAQALAEIPQEPQPPWRLWVWPVSLHSFGALFLLCGTQPHNPTAALHERAARGAQALAEIPQEPQPPWRMWVWPVSLHSFRALFLLCGTQPHNPTAWKSGQGSSGSRGNSARAAAPLAPVSLASVAPFIWRLVFALRHSTAQSNCCCTKWKSGQGSSGSRGNSARAAAPHGACEFGQCRSIHSAPCFCLRHSTAQSNCCTTWKSGARGAKALAEIPQEPQPPRRCSLCGQFAPDDKVPLPLRQFIIFWCCCRLAMQEWKSWLKMLKFSKLPWLAKLVKNDTDLVHSSTPHHCLSSPHVPFYGRQALAITRSNLSDGARFGACTTVCSWYFRHHFALGLHGKPCTSSALNHSFFCIKGLDEAGWHDINCQFLEWYGSGRSWSGKVWKQSTSSKLENALSARFACKYVVVIAIQNI